MISSLDKAILGTVGVTLASLTSSAAFFSWTMLREDSFPLGAPAPVVADLTRLNGSVKTRHRETLAWSGARTSQPLRDGDRIRTLTDATADIRYDDGLVVHLDPNSQVTVYAVTRGSGERLIADIQVVDGSIRAEMSQGHALAVRDADGSSTMVAPREGKGPAEVKLVAPDRAGGAVGLDVLGAGSVTVVGREGQSAQVVDGGQQDVFVGGGPTPTPTRVAIALPTPVPPMLAAPGLRDILAESHDLRFRLPIPPTVVEVQVQGKPCVLHEGGQFEVELFDLPAGNSTVDILYRHADGHWSRQVQKVRVRDL